jgi:polygalacturonase
MWSIHPTYCQNIDCKNLTIRSTGGNGDGIDIDSCQHVRIDACDISTGDDCIAIKSGRGMEAYALLKTTQDVQITNCTFADSIFACIGIGSETSGGIRDIRIQHCKFTHAQTQAIYIKTRIGRGAFIEDITADDLDITGPNNGFLRLNLTGSGIQDQFPVPGIDGIPTTKNFSFSNIHIASCPALVVATEISSAKPLDGFSLTNVSGTAAKGISLANIQNADIKNINVTGCAAPLVRIFNVTGSGLENAGTVDAPKIPATIPAATQPFQLR